MREIKFRIWDYRYEEMWEWDNMCNSEEDVQDLLNRRFSDLSPAMQYTGLQDKNGQDIYEGDIVKGVVMFHDDLWHVEGVIKYNHGRFVIGKYNCPLHKFSNEIGNKNNEIEVIGNEFEHPALLERVE